MMRSLPRRRGLVATGAGFLLAIALAGCGALSGPPNFAEVFGAVDQPCKAPATVPAAGAPSSTRAPGGLSCSAEVVLVNHGGSGSGYATVVVPIKAGTLQTDAAKCQKFIPTVAAGELTGLSCAFKLEEGQAVSGLPLLESVQAVASGSSGVDPVGLATLILAAVAAVLALAALWLARVANLRVPGLPSSARVAPARLKATPVPRPVERDMHLPDDADKLDGREAAAQPKLRW